MNRPFVPSYLLMATYELHYAQEHLAELFNEARSGEEVIIVRVDGRSCELVPLAEVKQEEPVNASAYIPDEAGAPGEMVPA